MNTYSEAFYKYVQNHPVDFDGANIDSLLEMFFWCYWEHNPMESERLRMLYRQLDSLLPEKVHGDVFNLVCCISVEQGRRAFQEGVRVGGQWMLEVQKKS